jgi:hypothetical protein
MADPHTVTVFSGAKHNRNRTELLADLVNAIIDGPDYAASDAASVSSTIAAPGNSAAFSGNAGRDNYLLLSGGTSASGSVKYSIDGGTTWARFDVQGVDMGAFTYVAASGAMIVPLPPISKYGAQLRVEFAAVTGTVSYILAQ